MKFVELYNTESDGSQKIMATCSLLGATVVCEGDPIIVENLVNNGIPDVRAGGNVKKLFPNDGIRFLEGLKFVFKSGYLNASDIMDKK